MMADTDEVVVRKLQLAWARSKNTVVTGYPSGPKFWGASYYIMLAVSVT